MGAICSSRVTGKPHLTGCLPVRTVGGRRRVIDELPTTRPQSLDALDFRVADHTNSATSHISKMLSDEAYWPPPILPNPIPMT
jgi:hypothetical protein